MDQHLLEVPVKQLSGGEQRRLSLLRALSIKPDFLVLDEVTSGLDVVSADAVLTLLENYHTHYGCSYLLIIVIAAVAVIAAVVDFCILKQKRSQGSKTMSENRE